MKENKFIVDLGTLKISPQQRNEINVAIQKAVSGQLASINLKNKVALYPISSFPRGPITNGIIARSIEIDQLNKIIGG
ncbi:MAG: hypothetical protein ABI315_05670 [Bacteroidia bacterium]